MIYIFSSKWIDLLKYESITDKFYENLQKGGCTPIKFFVEENFDNWHPKTHGPHNYLQSFIWLISFKNAGEKSVIHLQSFKMLVQEKGKYHLIKKGITMEPIRHLLIMKRDPNLGKVLEEITMHNKTYV